MKSRIFLCVVMGCLLLACASTVVSSSEREKEASNSEVDPLSNWTDQLQAQERGEGVAYLKAITEAARRLDDVSDDEIDRRLLEQAERLIEEQRWVQFIGKLMPTDCNRKLPWPRVADQTLRVGALVGINTGYINLALRPDASRQSRQEAVVKVEKEVPVITAARVKFANDVLTKVFAMTPIREYRGVDRIRQALEGQ